MIEARPLEGGIGAEVFGLDLSRPIDDSTREALYAYWLDFAILLFRGNRGRRLKTSYA